MIMKRYAFNDRDSRAGTARFPYGEIERCDIYFLGFEYTYSYVFIGTQVRVCVNNDTVATKVRRKTKDGQVGCYRRLQLRA